MLHRDGLIVTVTEDASVGLKSAPCNVARTFSPHEIFKSRVSIRSWLCKQLIPVILRPLNVVKAFTVMKDARVVIIPQAIRFDSLMHFTSSLRTATSPRESRVPIHKGRWTRT